MKCDVINGSCLFESANKFDISDIFIELFKFLAFSLYFFASFIHKLKILLIWIAFLVNM